MSDKNRNPYLYRFLRKQFFLWLLVFPALVSQLQSQVQEIDRQIAGSAYLENQSYLFLCKLSDHAGGRLAGTPGNAAAIQIIQEELAGIGYDSHLEKFRMPGWIRKEDHVLIISPFHKKLKSITLGYTTPTEPFRAEAVYAGYGYAEDYELLKAAGKVVLVTMERAPGKRRILRQEAIEQAAKHKAGAILFINHQPGDINLAGSGDFQGNPLLIPAFSLTREEGLWLQRMLEEGETVTLEIETSSYLEEIESANIVAKLPGVTGQKIVVGAHFDSWDLAQGSIDNGLGTAILFEVARLLKTFSPSNFYSVEFVWFNAEELGLFGSKSYVKSHNPDSILLMINMDMTGAPTGFNAMGFDELIPVLTELRATLPGFNLYEGVISRPWTNSDHMPFMFEGIPVVTLQAELDEKMLASYHSQKDTFDKVNVKYLSESSAVMTILVRTLANNRELQFHKKSEREMIFIFKRFGLEERLRTQKEWPYVSE